MKRDHLPRRARRYLAEAGVITKAQLKEILNRPSETILDLRHNPKHPLNFKNVGTNTIRALKQWLKTEKTS